MTPSAQGLTGLVAGFLLSLRWFCPAKWLVSRLEARSADPLLVAVLWELMGTQCMRVQRQNEAIQAFRAALLASERALESALLKGESKTEEEGETEEARKRITMLLGKALMQTGRYSEAADTLDVLLQEQSSVKPLLLAATCLHRSGDLRAAQRLCQEALRIDGECSSAHFRLCAVDMDLGAIEEALTHAEKGLKSDPDSVWGRILYAHCLLITGAYAQAVSNAQAVIRASPDSRQAYLVAADGLRRLGEFRDALEWITRLLSRWPSELHGHYQRVLCYASLGDVDKAEDSLCALAELPGSKHLVEEARCILAVERTRSSRNDR